MSSAVLYETKNQIGTITLNRPEKHNAFDENVIEELHHIVVTIQNDPNIRSVILSANGDNFCAGADLNWMKRMSEYDHEKNRQDALKLANLLSALDHFTKPIIALVQGHTLGGGIGLIANCDMVLASPDTRFCFSEARLGLIPATIAPYVIRCIGFNAARRYFLSTEWFNADEAQHMRLIHRIVNKNELHDEALRIAELFLLNSPNSLRMIKQMLNELYPVTSETLLNTSSWLADVRSSAEGKEGVRAFLEKRKPNWVARGS